MIDGVMMVVNGHFFKGFGIVITGFFRNRRLNKKYIKKLNSNGGK